MKETKLKKLYDLIGALPIDDRPNLAILLENEFLLSYRNRLSYSQYKADAGPVTGLRPERGAMMEFFAQLELLTNQILVAHLAASGGDIAKLEDVLDYVGLFSKIRLLNTWGLIDKRIQERLHRLRAARNGFAHDWDVHGIKYNGKPISAAFVEFQSDAALTFEALLNLYNGREVDIDRLIQEYQADKLQ